MGEPIFGTFALGLDNISWVIVAEIWLYTILCFRKNIDPAIFTIAIHDSEAVFLSPSGA